MGPGPAVQERTARLDGSWPGLLQRQDASKQAPPAFCMLQRQRCHTLTRQISQILLSPALCPLFTSNVLCLPAMVPYFNQNNNRTKTIQDP
jgi:hypothetical protein